MSNKDFLNFCLALLFLLHINHQFQFQSCISGFKVSRLHHNINITVFIFDDTYQLSAIDLFEHIVIIDILLTMLHDNRLFYIVDNYKYYNYNIICKLRIVTNYLFLKFVRMKDMIIKVINLRQGDLMSIH